MQNLPHGVGRRTEERTDGRTGGRVDGREDRREDGDKVHFNSIVLHINI